MTDRELLEAAAKAAGYNVVPHSNNRISPNLVFVYKNKNWNPLTDDGDALRLAVKLGMDINAYYATKETSACQFRNGIIHRCIEKSGDDPYAATRRAIVRAAAEIGAKHD